MSNRSSSWSTFSDGSSSCISAAMCGVQLKDRKRGKDLMLMLSLNKTMDQLTMANSIH